MPNRKLPANVAKLRGTYRPSRHGPPDAVPSLTPPDTLTPPAWLTPDARHEFERIAECMKPARVLGAVDADLLAVYSNLLVEFRAGPGTFQAAKLAQLRLLAGDLLLTPAARTKLPNESKAKDNRFAEIDGLAKPR